MKDRASQNFSVKNLRLAGVLLTLLLLMFTAALSAKTWLDVRRAHINQLSSFVELAATSIGFYFGGIEHDLQRLGADLLSGNRGTLDVNSARDAVAILEKLDSDVTLISVMIPNGRVLLPSASPALDAHFFRQDSVASPDAHGKQRPGGKFRILRPWHDPTLGQWVLPIQMELLRSGSGDVSRLQVNAAVPVERLQSLWLHALGESKGVFGLLCDEGYLASRFPPPPGQDLDEIYGKPMTGVLRSYLIAHGFPERGEISGIGGLDGNRYVAAFRRLGDFGMTVYAAVTVSEIAIAWWKQVAISYLLVAVMLAGGWAIYYRTELRQRSWDTEMAGAMRHIRNTEAREHDARERFESIISTAMDAIISVDETQRILMFNTAAEAMFGYRSADVVGRSVSDLIPGRFREAHAAHVHGFAESGVSRRDMGRPGEILGRRANGQEFPIEASISRVDSAGGRIFSVIMRDITERKRTQEQIEALNADLQRRIRELEAFSYSVAHDLRSPLRAINAFAQLLSRNDALRNDASAHDQLRRIAKNAVRMGVLLDGLLELSRVSRAKINLLPINLSAEVRGILKRFQAAEPERTVQTAVEPDVRVVADPDLVAVLLDNLLGNAWKFTMKRDMARIAFGSVTKDGEMVCFVRDNGVGFDMVHAARLFQPFERLHADIDIQGTGIGLATVQRVVERHGGRIWAESTPGEGTTFYFTFDDRQSGVVRTEASALTPLAEEKRSA